MENNRSFFNPPLKFQRYELILNLIKNSNFLIKTVADIGCSDGAFSIYLKNSDAFKEIHCLDINKIYLNECKDRLRLLACDYLQNRNEPMDIYFWLGNICEPDSRLTNLDAFVCIEIIEHIKVELLPLFAQVIFGFCQPKLAIITTPNADYNVVFNLTKEFRHLDHKFEWTQKQFSDWCIRVASDFQYGCTFTGVGEPPDNRPDVGFCSQVCVFTRIKEYKEQQDIKNYLLINHYKLNVTQKS